jgi:hypothetical protein
VHELGYRWSKPVYLFFASAVIINLLGNAFCTYDFLNKAEHQLREIVDLSKKDTSNKDQSKLKDIKPNNIAGVTMEPKQ